jgi:DNA primase
MFPIRNASGRLVGFGGRTLGDDKAKYVNTSETERFHKGFLLYGLHLAKREMRDSGRAILVEGYFDVIGTVASGLEGAVGGMGTALTPEQARLLARYAEEVVVAYDGDTAGETAFRRALPLLLGGGLSVRRAAFAGGHDPDSLRLAQGAEAVQAALNAAPDAVAAELERLIPAGANREPRRQSKAAAAVADLLRAVPDAVLRYSYARLAGQRLGIPPELLTRRGALAASEPAPGPGPQTPTREQLTRSLEENILERLVGGEEGSRLPPPAELPPAEVFLDPECRNIYQAFCTLYAGTGAPPALQALKARLDADEGAVARLAKIVLEGGEKELPPGRIGLLEALERLVSRWRRLRDKEPAGDEELARRFEERKRKSRSRRTGE